MNSTLIKNDFESCYEMEADSIYRFCLVRVSNQELAKDLTQETFTRMWQTMCKGAKIINSRAFLFAVAHRLIIDWYRKKKTVSIEADEESETGLCDYLSNESYLDIESKAEARHLIEMLKKIRPPNRQALYLRYVEDLSPPEISKILKISTDAVSVRINRGINELKKLVSDNK
jgi:RNA polymerase sigma-70 factor (ECF subfamily)